MYKRQASYSTPNRLIVLFEGLDKEIKEKSEEINSELLVMEESDMKQAKSLESTIKIDCEKCHNQEGVWWTFQTRSGDEPETKFYRCTKL